MAKRVATEESDDDDDTEEDDSHGEDSELHIRHSTIRDFDLAIKVSNDLV